MSFWVQFGKHGAKMDASPKLDCRAQAAAEDATLQQALANFRASVVAWSEAELSRPRTVACSSAMVVRRGSWRPAAGWALGCALVAGSLSGVVYEHRRHVEMAKMAAAARAAELARVAAAQRAREAEEDSLLAKVDSDVSREVPSAMEPLARLMAVDGSR